jgi:glucose-6-phosphate-specific signal transduction histidine kinase
LLIRLFVEAMLSNPAEAAGRADARAVGRLLAQRADLRRLVAARTDALSLQVAHADGGLTLRIRDDGRGGASLRGGTGLMGMVDRVAAAGGSLSLISPLGAGTLIEAVLPCAS